ncbi:hypothetical protein QOT17_021763 [Balamuthia mandrillaris]
MFAMRQLDSLGVTTTYLFVCLHGQDRGTSRAGQKRHRADASPVTSPQELQDVDDLDSVSPSPACSSDEEVEGDILAHTSTPPYVPQNPDTFVSNPTPFATLYDDDDCNHFVYSSSQPESQRYPSTPPLASSTTPSPGNQFAGLNPRSRSPVAPSSSTSSSTSSSSSSYLGGSLSPHLGSSTSSSFGPNSGGSSASSHSSSTSSSFGTGSATAPRFKPPTPQRSKQRTPSAHSDAHHRQLERRSQRADNGT